MGRKESWFHAVKKALGSQQKEKKDQKSKSKKELSSENTSTDAVIINPPKEEVINSGSAPSPPPGISEPKKLEIDVENVQNEQHAYSVALATAKAVEAAAIAAQAAAEPVRLATTPQLPDKSKEEMAAIKIQSAFRGFLARKVARTMRGMERLRSLIEGQSVKRQAVNTLRCMQTLARVQSQIHARRVRMAEENQALQRQLQLKHEKENETLKMGETWDDSRWSKEKIEANLQNKQEAAIRRERALAYAYTRQSRKNSQNSNQTFMDPNNPQWGWSWLERWMATRPWESRSFSEMDFGSDQGLTKCVQALSVSGEINRTNALKDQTIEGKKPVTNNARRLSRAPTPTSTSNSQGSTPRRSMSSTSRPSKVVKPGGSLDDGKASVMPQRQRRHSIAGTLLRDDDSLEVSPRISSHKGGPRSTRDGKKPHSPVSNSDQPKADEKPSVGPTKKRLSFSGPPAGARRHSVGGKMESPGIADTPIETK